MNPFNVTQRNSPNFNARDPSILLKYIVLHYTGMATATAAIDRLCDKKAEVSAHYVVEEDGHVWRLVDEDNRAWHAGKGSWFGFTDMNSASIGIEVVNPGHQFGYRAFPDGQIAGVKLLLWDIIKRRGFAPDTCLLAHSDIAPGRKEDPGELFPWQELAQDGLGLWPAPQAEDYVFTDDAAVQDLLRQVGYDCPATGHYDQAMRAALIAFQRRYEPRNLTGTPEKETIARLRAMVRLLHRNKKAA
jgi:N-acetylmuramoyl-L-alanine amidase